jgi:hypothetical protein
MLLDGGHSCRMGLHISQGELLGPLAGHLGNHGHKRLQP